jgi:hypothetical protein
METTTEYLFCVELWSHKKRKGKLGFRNGFAILVNKNADYCKLALIPQEYIRDHVMVWR